MSLMNTPTPRVWLATFVGLVFTIGVLTGIVVDRSWLNPAFTGGRGGSPRLGGPGTPGGPGRGGPEGRGARGPGGGPGRGGPMFGPPPQQYVEELSKEVKLTDAQQAEVLKLLQTQEPRLRAMQEDARATFIREQEGLHDRIAALLTPEQAAAFRTWVTQRTGRGRGQGPPR
jgi:hypothetical protein